MVYENLGGRRAGRVKRMRIVVPVSWAAVVLLAAGCGEQETASFHQAWAYQVTSRSQLVGGPKALGNIGDYVLENDRIRVLINGQATSMSGGGSNKWGGSILDADLRRFEEIFDPAVHGRDQLIELVPMFDIKTFGFDNVVSDSAGRGPVFRAPQDSVEIVDDGTGGGQATIRVSGSLHNLIWLLSVLEKPPLVWPLKAETLYTLEPGKNYVRITTTFTKLNQDGTDPGIRIEAPLRSVLPGENLFSLFRGEAFGDALFYGDSLDVIGPGVFGFSSGFYIEDLYGAGQSMFMASPQVEWSAGVARDVGYGLVADDGPLCFPVLEDFLTIAFQMVAPALYQDQPPGTTYTYTRYLIVDEGDVAGILNHVIDLKGWPHGFLKGRVIASETGRGVSDAHVLLCRHPRFSDGRLVPLMEDADEMNDFLGSLPLGEADTRRLIPYTRFRTDALREDTVEDGSFEGKVPPGEYILLAVGPGNVRSKLHSVRIDEGETREAFLQLRPKGRIRVSVRSREPTGPSEPAKVTFLGLEGQGRPDPYFGEGFLPAGLARVLLTQDGTGEVELPAGTYRVIAGRGPEYTVDEEVVSVDPLITREVRLSIDRVVDTSGWIAADLHMHTERSPDSSMRDRDRLLAAMSEGLDLIAGTDHDWIANYRPEQETMGALGLILTLRGDELSHFSYAHFNAYPLLYDQRKTSGGAPQWRDVSPTATLPDGSPMPEFTPQDCFDALRALTDRSEAAQDAFVAVNHPRESFTGYFRAFGFEQYSGTFGPPDFLTIGDPVVNDGKVLARNASKHFSWDFDGIEVLNGKRWQDFRTATQEEVAEPGSPLLPVLVRTVEEQSRILAGDLLLSSSEVGAIDDWLTLLAMGKRRTAIGSSDSHDAVKTENGKCRTYIAVTQDDPRFLEADSVLESLKRGRAIATNGPFVEAWVNGMTIGSDVDAEHGRIRLRIRAQAAPWISLDRVEVYGNGVLIGEITRGTVPLSYPSPAFPFIRCETEGLFLQGPERVERLDATFTCHLEADTNIVVMGIGFQGMTPNVTPVDGPAVELTDALVLTLRQTLGPLADLLPLDSLEPRLERHHPIYPFAVTNPIFVDTDGVDRDGDGFLYDAPGFIPGWFDRGDVPERLLADQDLQLMLLAVKSRLVSLSSDWDSAALRE